MGTPYSALYQSVLSKLKDYAFADMTDEEIYAVLKEYIRPAAVRFSTCARLERDDAAAAFAAMLSDDEIEILSLFMVVEYLDANFIRVPAMMRPALPSKDFAAFSPANHLSKLMDMRSLYMKEAWQHMRDYSYRVSPLFQREGAE